MNDAAVRLLDHTRVDDRYAYGLDQPLAGDCLPLPDSRILNRAVPAFTTWSTLGSPDQLFQHMGIDAFCQPDGTLRRSARATWQQLFHGEAFQTLAAPLIRHMGWYGAQPGEAVSPRMTQMLVGRSIVDHFLGASGTDREAMERATRRQWITRYSHVELYDTLRQQIHDRYPEASSATLDLLLYLLLRESLPELLISGVPEHLQYGRSLQSIALIHGTLVIEAMGAALSACVSCDELVRVSAVFSAATDPAIQALRARALVRPALLYASAHQAIELSDDDFGTASAGQIAQAIACLQAAQDAHAAELHRLLSLQAPDRRQLAENLLRQAGVAEIAWTLPADSQSLALLQAHGLSLAWSSPLDRLAAWARPPASLVELVMMGEVWREGQATVPDAYEQAWQVYEAALRSAQAAVIARLLAEMPPAQREVLLNSTCELSRIRFAGGEGVQGLFIRCRQADNPIAGERFFELFPAAGVIRPTRQRFTYHPEHRSIDSLNLPELWRNHEANLALDAKAPFIAQLPFDSDAYLHGRVSRRVTDLHAPALGELVAAAQPCAPGPLAVLAEAAARHLLAGFLKQNKDEHRHLSGWEQTWAREREWADTAARWLVPFYGCIKDLSSGDYSTTAVSECSLDAVSALIPVGQFVAATARVLLHAGEISVRSLALQAGASVVRLTEGLAQQSAAFLVRDTARAAARVGQAAVDLVHELPSLKRVLSEPAVLKRSAPDLVLRQRAPLSPAAARLEQLARTCRVRRELVPVACADGIMLMTPAPSLAEELPEETVRTGQHYSHAMAARRFELATMTAQADTSLPAMAVFVYENRLCTWQATAGTQTSAQAALAVGTTVEVSETDRLLHDLPAPLRYRQQISATRLDEPLFGLTRQAPGMDLEHFNRQAPVIRLGSIVYGVADSRTLRGVRLEQAGQSWIYLEPDRSVFYRAPEPADSASVLQLERVRSDDEGLGEFLMHTEQYRLVREVPGIWQDRQNIARMLFDMLDETERALLPEPGMTFEQYQDMCRASQRPNDFLEYASKVLSGKSFQDVYIALARQTVADFKSMVERSPAQAQALADVLNNLLPARPARKGWAVLSADSIVQPAAIKRIRKQVNGANLAFAAVQVDGRQAYVFYAVSGGQLGEHVRLQPERPWTDGAFINGVDYIDARPQAPSLSDPDDYAIPDDPRFTTLPALRHAERLEVRAVNRSLDSERLIGTRIKDELQAMAGSVTRIDFFTLLDACRSCGGFALPRLRRDFPQAEFSVTYLKPYQDD